MMNESCDVVKVNSRIQLNRDTTSTSALWYVKTSASAILETAKQTLKLLCKLLLGPAILTFIHQVFSGTESCKLGFW